MRRRMLVMLVACSHPNTGPTGTAYRDAVVPAALALRPATLATASCIDAGPLERSRVIAALDRSLRTTGGYVLRATPIGFWRSETDGPMVPGAIGRGRFGERLMFVANITGCGKLLPTFVIDGTRAVFTPVPVVVTKTHRTVTACNAECNDGCGDALTVTALGVEVPAGAHFVASHSVDVTMDVEVTVRPGVNNCSPAY